MLNPKPRRLIAAPLLSAMLLSACASQPQPPLPAQPIIPPLPAAARQIDSLQWLDSVLDELQSWLQWLEDPSSEARPAKGSTTP